MVSCGRSPRWPSHSCIAAHRPTRASPHEPTPPACLVQVRDYIHDSLYSPVHGYFTRQAPVGFLPEGIDFGGLAGQTAYLAAVQQRYRDLQVAWMTPAGEAGHSILALIVCRSY